MLSVYFLHPRRSVFYFLAHWYSQPPQICLCWGAALGLLEPTLPACKENQTCLEIDIAPAATLNQRLVRWGINISFLFALIGTAFRLDLHCLPNSPQDWAKVPLAWGPTGLCFMSPLCLASLPSCHFPIALWFSLGNTLNHFHTDLCFRICLWGLFDKIPRVSAQHK